MHMIWLLLAVVAVCAGQQQSVTNPLVFNARTPYTVPQQMFEFLERYHWGDFHLVFHMTRKYYVVGTQGRQWIDSIMEKPAPYQEGDPNNGVEFLAMHRSMIEYLRQRFGRLPVTGDPDKRATVGDVLDGWSTDSMAANGLRALGGDASTFQAGLSNVNNFGQFKTEDEFGRFIQTAMRLQGTVDPNNPSNRHYTYDQRPGSGVHNWMHGQLQDDNSPITVGDPRTNLPNILFWRIHGWIEAKWKQFEAAHTRSSAEQQLYDGFVTQFRAHMISMSDRGTQSPPPPPPSNDGGSSSSGTGRQLQGLRSQLTTTERRLGRNVQRMDGIVNRIADRDAIFQIVDRVRRSLARIHQAIRGRRVPWSLVFHVRSRMFRNHVPDCSHLARGTTAENCPDGRNTVNRIPVADLAHRPQQQQQRRANLANTGSGRANARRSTPSRWRQHGN